MQKLKRIVYDKIIDSKDSKLKLSRLEIKFIFYIAMRCNESGTVAGIYYADIANDLKCSIAKFYHLRDNLERKKFITWEKNNIADIDITLIENNFMQFDGSEYRAVYSDYIDIDINIFHDEEFWKKKAGSIKMAMYFIKRVAAQKAITLSNDKYSNKNDAEISRKNWFKPYNEYKTLAGLLNVSIRIIKRYMKELECWITIAHNIQSEGEMWDISTVLSKALLRPEHDKFPEAGKKKNKIYPERIWYIHFIKTFCRRNKITFDEESCHLADTAELIRQYKNIAKDINQNIFTLICRAITNVGSSLNSFNIHKALRNIIKYNEPGVFD